jgi:uncharacterized protein YhdP
VLAPATLSESWRPAVKGKPERVEVRADRVDLGALAALASQMPLTSGQRQLLEELAPRGRLVDVDAEWQGRFPKLAGYRVRGQVEGLGMNALAAHEDTHENNEAAHPAHPAIPGFHNLSGSLDASDEGGSVSVDASKLALALPAWFADPEMRFDQLALRARWSWPQADQLLVEVDNLHFAQGALKGTLSGRHLLPLGSGHGPGSADFNATVDNFDIASIGRFLPLATHEGLRDWLTGALQGGTLHARRIPRQRPHRRRQAGICAGAQGGRWQDAAVAAGREHQRDHRVRPRTHGDQRRQRAHLRHCIEQCARGDP